MFKVTSLKQIDYLFLFLFAEYFNQQKAIQESLHFFLSLKLMYVCIVFCFLSAEKKYLMSYFAACKKIICCVLLIAHREWKPSEPADFTNYSWFKPSLTRTLF